MKNASRISTLVLTCVAVGLAIHGQTQDWPQWRGPNRDARASGFNAPKTWPKELTQKWKMTVGAGDATPALVGDRLYLFKREEGNEGGKEQQPRRAAERMDTGVQHRDSDFSL